MTEDQIERRAEWMMDNLDRHFTRKPHQCARCRKTVPNDRGMIECPEPVTQATYDAKCRVGRGRIRQMQGGSVMSDFPVPNVRQVGMMEQEMRLHQLRCFRTCQCGREFTAPKGMLRCGMCHGSRAAAQIVRDKEGTL